MNPSHDPVKRARGIGGIFARLRPDTRGATAVEYGLIITFIVIAMISALSGVARVTTSMWNDVSDKVQNAGR